MRTCGLSGYRVGHRCQVCVNAKSAANVKRSIIYLPVLDAPGIIESDVRAYLASLGLSSAEFGVLEEMALMTARMVDRAAAGNEGRLIVSGTRMLLVLKDRVDALSVKGRSGGTAR